MERANGEPSDVAALKGLLLSLPGITEVGVSPVSLVGLSVDDLSLADMADLPSAALRRTGGALPGESVVQVWLEVAPRPESFRTLEFLAWHVRDSARGGDVTQMRVRGLPPRVGGTVQLGSTLLFVIEWFVIHSDGDLESLLARIREETASLKLAIGLYGNLLAANE